GTRLFDGPSGHNARGAQRFLAHQVGFSGFLLRGRGGDAVLADGDLLGYVADARLLKFLQPALQFFAQFRKLFDLLAQRLEPLLGGREIRLDLGLGGADDAVVTDAEQVAPGRNRAWCRTPRRLALRPRRRRDSYGLNLGRCSLSPQSAKV